MVTSSKPLPTTKYGMWSFSAAAIVLVVLGIAAFRLVSGSPSFLNAVPWLIPLTVTGLAFIAYGLWILFGPRQANNDAGPIQLRRQARLLALAFFAFLGTGITVGGLYFGELAETLRAQRFRQQFEIAALKAQLVERWLLDRSAEIQQTAAALDSLRRAANGSTADTGAVVQLLFAEMLARNPDLRSVALIGADGKTFAHAGADPVLPEETEETIAAMKAPLAPRVVPLKGDEATSSLPGVSFFQPLNAGAAAGVAPAMLVARVNPAPTLFRELDQWPADSTGSAVILVRHDGDTAYVIKPAWGLKPDTKGTQVSLKETRRPSVQAILQGNGVRDGVDGSGQPVFSAAYAIAGTPWYLVVRTSQSELTRPLWRSVTSVAIFIVASIVVAGVMLVVIWATLHSDYLALRARHSEEKATLFRRFQDMVLQAYDIVLLMAPDGRILEANKAATAAYGYSGDELRALTIRDLRTPAALKKLDEQWKLGDERDSVRYETEHRRKDGTSFPVEVSASIVDVDRQRFRQEFVRDISERRRLEAELKRLARVQRALQAANSMLLRARSEQELFVGMCESAVAIGGYRMANVALANDDAQKSVTFAAVAGIDDGYLAGSGISWGKGPRGDGPAGTAIRTGRVQISQNMATDPRMTPWREEALKRHFQSCISLPLQLDGRTFGVFSIYSDVPDAFDDEEVALLRQFAEDISYGVSALRSRPAASGRQPSA